MFTSSGRSTVELLPPVVFDQSGVLAIIRRSTLLSSNVSIVVSFVVQSRENDESTPRAITIDRR